jgi:hypothetical protein
MIFFWTYEEKLIEVDPLPKMSQNFVKSVYGGDLTNSPHPMVSTHGHDRDK